MGMFEHLAKIDLAAVQFEKSKRELETAKLNFEKAKQSYDEVLTEAESMGLSKSKLKRVAEERVSALFDIGLIEMGKTAEAKTEKPAKAKKKNRTEENQEESTDNEEQGHLFESAEASM
ncbi:MAG: hypothetical protein ACXVCP_19440 [Bdellovibrio sp.]